MSPGFKIPRRALLGNGATALGTALAVKAIAAASQAAAAQGASQPRDHVALARMIEAEQLEWLVYRRVLASGELGERAARTLRDLPAQERQHIQALEGQRRLLGARRPRPVKSDQSADALLARHGFSERAVALSGERQCLRLLADVEAIAIGVYYKSMSTLHSVPLIELSSQMMASDAQHAAVLGELLSPRDYVKAVPDAFVEGKT
jgi:hypothetical protein